MNIVRYGECIPESGTTGRPVLSVLYVDDEPSLLDIGKLFLERHADISVSTASSVDHALILLESTTFDVIVSDYQMPGRNGIDFLRILQRNRPPIPFILFTGFGREEIMTDALNNGATFYLQKGGNPRTRFAELGLKIREAYLRHRAGKN